MTQTSHGLKITEPISLQMIALYPLKINWFLKNIYIFKIFFKYSINFCFYFFYYYLSEWNIYKEKKN